MEEAGMVKMDMIWVGGGGDPWYPLIPLYKIDLEGW
jgi:hypothetical protein